MTHFLTLWGWFLALGTSAAVLVFLAVMLVFGVVGVVVLIIRRKRK